MIPVVVNRLTGMMPGSLWGLGYVTYNVKLNGEC